METAPPEEKLIEGLQSFAEEVGGVPTIRGMRNEGPYSPHYYKQKFGSWHDALRAADIQPTHGIEIDVDREELLDDLRRVADQCEDPPRRRDVEEYGEYPYDCYEEEFDSFIRALEAIGIEPTEKQYRFSSVETPDHKKGSANIEKLRNEGPTPGGELPSGMSANDRQLGMWKFDINSGSTQPADPVYYLDGEHAPELVLRRFFKHNPHVLEYRDPHGIKIAIGNHKPSWKDRGQEIVDELVRDESIEHAMDNLVLVELAADETLNFCFERSVGRFVDTNELQLNTPQKVGRRPLWGFPREYTDLWKALTPQDGILFSTEPGVFTHYVPVDRKESNNDVMTELWVEYDDEGIRSDGINRPWPNVVIGAECVDCYLPIEEISADLNCEVDEESIQWLGNDEVQSVANRYGRFQLYLQDNGYTRDSRGVSINLEGDLNVEEAVDALVEFASVELPPVRVESQVQQIDQETRLKAFREGIRDVYEGCGLCGADRESPRGATDIEAAHIVPKRAGGPDILRNGLALCSKHHWAFDNGWFEISTEYEIHVKDRPELEGYEEFQQYDGQTLNLPSKQKFHPHPKYITEKNTLVNETN